MANRVCVCVSLCFKHFSVLILNMMTIDCCDLPGQSPLGSSVIFKLIKGSRDPKVLRAAAFNEQMNELDEGKSEWSVSQGVWTWLVLKGWWSGWRKWIQGREEQLRSPGERGTWNYPNPTCLTAPHSPDQFLQIPSDPGTSIPGTAGG